MISAEKLKLGMEPCVARIISDMVCRRSRLTAVILLLICLLCPIIESLDMWHPSFDDGNDTEFALVIGALSIGAGYVVACLIFESEFVHSQFGSVLADSATEFFGFILGFRPLRFAEASPPLLPLRI